MWTISAEKWGVRFESFSFKLFSSSCLEVVFLVDRFFKKKGHSRMGLNFSYMSYRRRL